MDAIAGIYDPEADRLAVEVDLARMRRALELPSPGARAESASAAGAACAVLDHRGVSPAPCIVRERERGVWLAFIGELYDGDVLRARLGGAAECAGGDASLCLHLYLAEGADFLTRLNGHFTAVLYHEAERRLLLATDRFGYRPLFLASRGRRLLFASEMKAILAALDSTPAVDGIGLLELAAHGWPLGDRTWLEPIRLADAGTCYESTPRGTTRRRYFRFGFRRGAEASSLPAYVDGFAEKLRRAMLRATALPGRAGLALSGGLDSRALLLAADGSAGRLLTYSFGDALSRDVRYAGELARIAGAAHLHLPYESGYLGRLLLPIVWRSEGLLPFSAATFTSMHFHPALARHVDVLVYGQAGDALTGAHLPHAILLYRSRERMIERLFRQYNPLPEAVLKSVFRPGFYARFAPDRYEALRATFDGIEAEELADVLGVWDLENRQRRGVFASTTVDRCRFGVRAPFLEHELVDHVRQAAPSWRLHQLAYKRMIRTAFPAAAGVRWTHTGTRVQKRHLADVAALARGVVHRRLSLRSSGSDPRTFRDLRAHTRGDPLLAQAIRDFAASSQFPAEVFDRRGIEDVVRRHWDAGENLTHLVSMLATFAAAHRLLLWQRPGAIPAEAVPAA